MSSEHTFEQKGKVKPKPTQETAEPKKDEAPLTKSRMQGDLDAQTLTQMQKTVGNAAVQRFLAQRQSDGPSEVQEETAEAIQSKRGGGQSLDAGIAEKAGSVMGQDFSDVNVHTDSQSDELNKQLGAKAFTTGNDIFFRSGAYNPGNSDGQRLISHELTHVAQQGAAQESLGRPPSVQGKMTVNDPNDQYESEADNVADLVMNHPEDVGAQRQIEEEEPLQAQEVPEEEEALQAQEIPEEEEAIQKQEEEEMVQMQEEEEEMIQPQEEEEEMAQMQDIPEEEQEMGA
jgi:hypothetical protein